MGRYLAQAHKPAGMIKLARSHSRSVVSLSRCPGGYGDPGGPKETQGIKEIQRDQGGAQGGPKPMFHYGWRVAVRAIWKRAKGSGPKGRASLHSLLWGSPSVQEHYASTMPNSWVSRGRVQASILKSRFVLDVPK